MYLNIVLALKTTPVPNKHQETGSSSVPLLIPVAARPYAKPRKDLGHQPPLVNHCGGETKKCSLPRGLTLPTFRLVSPETLAGKRSPDCAFREATN